MDGCIYRTKDGECALWENDRNHSPFCNPECPDKHPSNADRIRAMTDEELAIWLASITDCGECEIYSYKDGCMASDEACACQWLDWLKQEATE